MRTPQLQGQPRPCNTGGRCDNIVTRLLLSTGGERTRGARFQR